MIRIVAKVFLGSCVASAATVALGGSACRAEDMPVLVIGETECEASLCNLHIVSEEPIIVRSHLPGMPEVIWKACSGELDALLAEDGTGEVHNVSFASCQFFPCTTGGTVDHWPLVITEEAGDERLELTLCMKDGNGVNQECSIELDVNSVSGHQFELTAADDACHGTGQPPWSFQSHWLTEAESSSPDIDEVEVIHL